MDDSEASESSMIQGCAPGTSWSGRASPSWPPLLLVQPVGWILWLSGFRTFLSLVRFLCFPNSSEPPEGRMECFMFKFRENHCTRSILREPRPDTPGAHASGGLEGVSEQELCEPRWSRSGLLRDVEKERSGQEKLTRPSTVMRHELASNLI